MRPKLLKKIFRNGEIAMGLSVGIMVSRFVVDRVTKKMEKSARTEEALNGTPDPATARNLRVLRAVRGVLHIL